MLYIGIDPGLYGALAYCYDDKPANVLDTPIFLKQRNSKVSAKSRTSYDVLGLAELINQHSADDSLVVIEQPVLMPKQSSLIGSFNSGYGFGLWRMAIANAGFKCEIVTAAGWKKSMRLTSNKNHCRLTAIELFPHLATKLKRIKDDGRAEALLLMEYARRLYGKQ